MLQGNSWRRALPEARLKDQIERIEKVSEERGSDLNAMKQKIMKARKECANIVVNVLEPIISEMKNHMPNKRMIQAVNKLNTEQKAKFDLMFCTINVEIYNLF